MRRFDAVIRNTADYDKRHFLIVRDADNMKVVLFEWIVSRLARSLPDVAAFGGVLLLQAIGVSWVLRGPARNAPRWARSSIIAVTLASMAIVMFGFLLNFARVTRHLPLWWLAWGRGVIMGWAMLSSLLVIAFGVSQVLPRPRPEHSPARRRFLQTARVTLFAAPAAAVGYGMFVERLQMNLREQTIQIPGLHPDLDGLRIVQLTDIHLSAFLPERVLERAVAMANETRAHVALVTGDLISFKGDPVDACLDRLKFLRADAGVFGCMGNHEGYAGTENYTQKRGAELGMRFLRLDNTELRFGNASINLAGVDYQRMHGHYLRGAGRLVRPGALNILMSHNPDVFPVAAEQGWDLTIAGHTHGGQVKVSPGTVLHFRLARHRDHRIARPAGRASRSGPHSSVPYLILADIHANLEALEAVLKDAKGRYDRILCLGDLVGYGADPNAIVEWTRSHVAAVVRGNHDKDCSSNDSLEHYRAVAAVSAVWTRQALTAENTQYLRALARGPLRYDDFDLCHGSPGDEDEYLLFEPDISAQRQYLESQATFFGHTHMQGGFLLTSNAIRRIYIDALELEPDYFYLINPGSVGQPRDGDPRAAYIIYDPKKRLVEFRRVDYDIQKAAKKIRAAGLPDALAHRLTLGA
jgi:predicted MPP superfamily phosphohydrolase/diadenosine tetraphosphatase ApaH/serine/threonine PP2A family protein phosphatase